MFGGMNPAKPKTFFCSKDTPYKMRNEAVTKAKAFEGLEPQNLWHHFRALSRIPRCSRQEERVRDYVLEVAKRAGMSHRADRVGNVVVKAPARPGREDRPRVVLQAHLDMVCEKNKETVHDFSTEGIRLKREGDWILADGTTLGADNGIGVAACLAVLESRSIKRGPIECLFSVDEETGLTGAMGLESDMLEGRMLINTDSEEDGVLYIGCAGGKVTELFLPLETEPVSDGGALRLHLGGLQGGHSGIEINQGRANAIRLLARFLWQETRKNGLRVAWLEGGSKHNAIPRECEALVCLAHDRVRALESAAADFRKALMDEYGHIEPSAFFSIEEEGFIEPKNVFTPAFEKRLLNLLFGMPNGVIAMSRAVPGLVQTSTTLAVVQTQGAQVRIATSQRGSVPSQLTEIADMVCAVGQQAGAEIRQGGGYSGWQPNPKSPLLQTARSVFTSLYGHDPQVKAIHAGLECGIIGDKFAGMDMISFGPTITGAHSPSERVQISTVKRFWDFLVALLENLAV